MVATRTCAVNRWGPSGGETRELTFVGAEVGASVGEAVGECVTFVGADVGACVGEAVGAKVMVNAERGMTNSLVH